MRAGPEIPEQWQRELEHHADERVRRGYADERITAAVRLRAATASPRSVGWYVAVFRDLADDPARVDEIHAAAASGPRKGEPTCFALARCLDRDDDGRWESPIALLAQVGLGHRFDGLDGRTQEAVVERAILRFEQRARGVHGEGILDRLGATAEPGHKRFVLGDPDSRAVQPYEPRGDDGDLDRACDWIDSIRRNSALTQDFAAVLAAEVRAL